MSGHFNPKKELAEQSKKDWVFGSAIRPSLTDYMTELDREKCLPFGEVQRGKEDTMDCASRSPVNILETQFNWLYRNNKLDSELKDWLLYKGYVVYKEGEFYIEFSDAFVAINSGTTRNGNSLKAPLEAIRKQGLIPKSMLPLENRMKWEDYHDPQRITKDMLELGKQFTERFTINYDRVYAEYFESALGGDMLTVAGYAWPHPQEGEYGLVQEPPNHAFMLYARPMSYAFDNYYDVVDNDFVKKLTKDYRFFEYGYRIYISSQQNCIVHDNLLTKLINYWYKLWQRLRTLQSTTPAEQWKTA